MKKTLSYASLRGLWVLIVGCMLVFNSCEKDIAPNQPEEDIKTVSVNEALRFLETHQSQRKVKAGKEPYVTPDTDYIHHEEITNSNQKLTVIPATTIYPEHYSRIVMLKVEGKIRSVVFSMFSDENDTDSDFSGEIIITDLDGNFINGYRACAGQIISQFKKKRVKNQGVCEFHGKCDPNVPCVMCNNSVEEVKVTPEKVPPRSSLPIHFVLYIDYSGGEEEGSWIYGGGGSGGNLPDLDLDTDKDANKKKIQKELCDTFNGIINVKNIRKNINNLTIEQEQFIISLANLAAFSELGLLTDNLRKDLINYSTDNSLYSKYNKLNNSQNYIKGWKKAGNSSNNSNTAYVSPKIKDTGFQLKYYPEKNGEHNAIGLVREGFIGHRVEAALEMIERWYIDNKGKPDDFLYDMHLFNAVNFMKDYCND